MTIKQTIQELGKELWYVIIHLIVWVVFIIYSPVWVAGFLWSIAEDMWAFGYHAECTYSNWIYYHLRKADAADAQRTTCAEDDQ
jgi:hypothetical protein